MLSIFKLLYFLKETNIIVEDQYVMCVCIPFKLWAKWLIFTKSGIKFASLQVKITSCVLIYCSHYKHQGEPQLLKQS